MRAIDDISVRVSNRNCHAAVFHYLDVLRVIADERCIFGFHSRVFQQGFKKWQLLGATLVNVPYTQFGHSQAHYVR